jgi:hypothetical protein
MPIAVKACTDLTSPVWTPLQTLNLTNGSFYFSRTILSVFSESVRPDGNRLAFSA